MNLVLLQQLLRVYPAQPATAFWRAIEVAAILRNGLPRGFGLDLGCGDGALTDILLRMTGARRLVGIDVDPRETAVARRYPFYDRIHTCSSEHIPEASGEFDFAISNSVLEHIADLDGAMAEIGRLLRPGGRLVFTVPGPGFHRNLGGGGASPGARARYLAGVDRRLAHLRYLTRDEWEEVLGRHGLALSRCVGYMTPQETRRWERLSALTGGLLYAVFGGRLPPIEIQRRLGARQLQNRWKLPKPVVGWMGRVIARGIPGDDGQLDRTGGAAYSCLLIDAYRT